MLWAVRDGEAVVRRRRATAARERERLAGALRGSPFSFAAGHGHLVWLSSTDEDGAAIARRLAGQRIYVTPGAAWGDERHVRIALRGAAATDRLAGALLG
jgi:histidinol-phosphate/aromatic aminotransferase/cobyric acid decarboxylase-like protein